MRREERNMDKLLISFLLSLFMVYFPPSDVVLPSQFEASTDSYVPMSSYPQETQSAKRHRRAACTRLS